MKGFYPALLGAISVGLLVACSSGRQALDQIDEPKSKNISVISNGWHTAIVLPGPEVAKTGLLPESADFPGAAFLEFGWGDKVYYPAKDPTFDMALVAAMKPSPAVMHVAVRRIAPYSYDGLEVIEMTISESTLVLLIKAIAAEFERPEEGRAVPISIGLYPQSRFYEARGTFHLFNTCNTWTARMLQEAGLNISPIGVSSANEVMARLSRAVNSP